METIKFLMAWPINIYLVRCYDSKYIAMFYAILIILILCLEKEYQHL